MLIKRYKELRKGNASIKVALDYNWDLFGYTQADPVGGKLQFAMHHKPECLGLIYKLEQKLNKDYREKVSALIKDVAQFKTDGGQWKFNFK